MKGGGGREEGKEGRMSGRKESREEGRNTLKKKNMMHNNLFFCLFICLWACLFYLLLFTSRILSGIDYLPRCPHTTTTTTTQRKVSQAESHMCFRSHLILSSSRSLSNLACALDGLFQGCVASSSVPRGWARQSLFLRHLDSQGKGGGHGRDGRRGGGWGGAGLEKERKEEIRAWCLVL